MPSCTALSCIPLPRHGMTGWAIGSVIACACPPPQGVNGSGKHNNWSLATDDGTNLLNVPQVRLCVRAYASVCSAVVYSSARVNRFG